MLLLLNVKHVPISISRFYNWNPPHHRSELWQTSREDERFYKQKPNDRQTSAKRTISVSSEYPSQRPARYLYYEATASAVLGVVSRHLASSCMEQGAQHSILFSTKQIFFLSYRHSRPRILKRRRQKKAICCSKNFSN